MKEIWKDIKGYEGIYQVSNLGRVKSLTRKINYWGGKRTAKGKILKNLITRGSYPCVDLRQNQKHKTISVHRLVATAFIPNPNNYPVINHKDNDPSNNKVDNLEWCTQSYNVKYAYIHGNAKPTAGCFKKGCVAHNRKKINQYTKNKEFIATFASIKEAAEKTSTNSVCISNCCKHKQITANNYIWEYAD